VSNQIRHSLAVYVLRGIQEYPGITGNKASNSVAAGRTNHSFSILIENVGFMLQQAGIKVVEYHAGWLGLGAHCNALALIKQDVH
jgi:hypothetical protein